AARSMMPPLVRFLALPLSAALALAACSPGGNAPSTTQDAAGKATQKAAESVTAQVSGAGASFVYPLVSRWSADYNAATGHKVSCQSIGSGGGIAPVKAGTVDFGSSDTPLPPEELAEAGLAQFPSAVGGVVPVFNLEGVEPGQLRLTGKVLADRSEEHTSELQSREK